MKKVLLAAATIAVIGVGVSIPNIAANAQGGTGKDSIVDKLVTRFHLNRADVQKVFDENRSEHQALRAQAEKDRLAKLVESGDLTQTQADLIIAKRAEMRAEMDKERENFTIENREEHRTEMQVRRAELEKWAKDNGIDEQYIMHQGRGMGPHM